VIVETVRISDSGRQKLIRIKTRTGIQQWNVLGRWALALSLAEQSAPPLEDRSVSSGIDISWKVFAGALSEPLTAAVRMRFHSDAPYLPGISAPEHFHLHLHRGISYLSAGIQQSVSDLLKLSLRSWAEQ
jgi:DNA sulfur modification protein DndE